MYFKTQAQLDKYVSERKNPQKSKYWGFVVPDGGISKEEIDAKIQSQKTGQNEDDQQLDSKSGTQSKADQEVSNQENAPSESSNTDEQKKDHHYYDVNSQYEWARKSEVQNLGEDVAGAARHKRNKDREWGSFSEFVQEMSLEDIDRKSLEKAFPIPWSDLVEQVGAEKFDCLFTLKAVMAGFPSSIGINLKKEDFVNEYQLLRDKVLAHVESIKNGDAVTTSSILDSIRADLAKRHSILSKQGIIGDLERSGAEVIAYRDLIANIHNNYSPHKKRSPDGIASEINRSVLNDFVDENENKSLFQLQSAIRKLKTSGPGALTEQELSDVESIQKDTLLRYRKYIRGEGTGVERKKSTNQKQPLREDSFYKDTKLFREAKTVHFEKQQDAESYLRGEASFRGVQYGSYVEDEKRRSHLLNAANAFKDFGAAIGLPSKKMSLDGTLAIAFGARGTGKSMAHYEPDQHVMNFTKDGGYGALAHEWGHGLDYYLRKNKDEYYNYVANGKNPSLLTPKVEAYETIKKAYSSLQKMKSRIQNEQSFWKIAPVSRMYWLKEEELFARAFESYTKSKLDKIEVKNTYLVAGIDSYLWPTQSETEELTPIFDKLIAAFGRS